MASHQLAVQRVRCAARHPDGVPQEVDEWIRRTIEQVKASWSACPDTRRIEELRERIRELRAEADQQRQLPPSAQPLALPAPAQQRTKAAWRK